MNCDRKTVARFAVAASPFTRSEKELAIPSGSGVGVGITQMLTSLVKPESPFAPTTFEKVLAFTE